MLFNVYGDFNFLWQTPLSGFSALFIPAYKAIARQRENDERKGCEKSHANEAKV